MRLTADWNLSALLGSSGSLNYGRWKDPQTDQLLADFAGNFYPLTQLSMVTGNTDPNEYGWTEGPMPWEGACI